MSWIKDWLLLFTTGVRVRELADLDLDPHSEHPNPNTENTVLLIN